jgi:hypothetical protein
MQLSFMTTTPTNRYFVCLNHVEEPIAWNPFDRSQAINIHTAYFGRVAEAMEQALEVDGLTFFLTWDVHTLPRYGSDVVAIVLGDEWCRVPLYAHKIRATFKCYGTRPTLGCNPLRRPTYKNLLTTAHFLRMQAVRIPGMVHHRYHKKADDEQDHPIYPIPLGYANQVELPVKPIHARQHDLSFAGSVVHKPYSKRSLKYWLQTPKSLSRREMIAVMHELQERQPSWNVDLVKTKSYSQILTSDPLEYSQRMMDTKVSLVPRGTSFETFRFFEAMRSGCVVVTEALPSRWFYDDSPAIRVRNWHELHELIPPLLNNPERLQEKHEASLEWWSRKCSEETVGFYIAERLNDLHRETSNRIPSSPARQVY